MWRRFLITVATLVVLATPAEAQQTRSQMNAYNNNNIGANGVNAITGPVINTMNSEFINSFGVLGDANVWTGTNLFLGPVNIPGGSYVPCAAAIAGTVCRNSSGFLVVAQ